MPIDHRKKIQFLLGSGSSIPAGLPSTSDITQCVLSDCEFSRHSNGSYVRKHSQAYCGQKEVKWVTEFTNIVYRAINSYYSGQQNYEHLYFIIDKIENSISGGWDDPTVEPFTKGIEQEVKDILSNGDNNWDLRQLAEESANYIHDIATILLEPSLKDLDYLGFLIEAYNDDRFEVIDIFTLNHDRVLEQFLERKGICFSRGFSTDPDGDLFQWEPSTFDIKSVLRLFKMHGSIDWFQYAWGETGCEKHVVALRTQNEYPDNGVGNKLVRDPVRPLMLIGTHNKIPQYMYGIFMELYYRFYRSLQQTDVLVVIGYGFGDIGVNVRIEEWLESSTNNRLLLIDTAIGDLRSCAKGRIVQNWDQYCKRNQLVLFEKSIKDVTWKDMTAKLK